MNKIFYTAKELATELNVSERTAYDYGKKDEYGLIEFTKKTPSLIYKKENFKKAIVTSFMNQKGGCGKTSLSVHLAIYLSKLKFKVLLIDTDTQDQCKLFFEEQEYDNTFREAIAKEKPIEDCIYKCHTKDSELDFIPSSPGLGLFILETQYNNKEGMKDLLDPIIDKYDFIIIDTSPTFDIITVSVAKVSDSIIIPITPTAMHIAGMGTNFDILHNIIKIPNDNIKGIILNIVDDKEAEQRDYISMLETEYEDLFPIKIPKSARMRKLAAYSTNIFDEADNSKVSLLLKQFTFNLLHRI